jgi:hypothetical protein
VPPDPLTLTLTPLLRLGRPLVTQVHGTRCTAWVGTDATARPLVVLVAAALPSGETALALAADLEAASTGREWCDSQALPAASTPAPPP